MLFDNHNSSSNEGLYNEIDFYRNKEKMSVGIVDAKQIFGANLPYVVERRLNGKEFIFNDHFIGAVIEALTTGCMSRMSADENELFDRFVKYENGSGYRDITEGNVDIGQSLDNWLSRLVRCDVMPVINGCYDKEPVTIKTCAMKKV